MNRDASGAARRSSDTIEADIGHIRARMEHTLDEIEFRMSPGQMASGALDLLRDVVRADPRGATAGRIGRAIRENPIPVVLIGIGAVWLGLAISRQDQRIEGTAMVRDDEPRLAQQQRLGPQLLILAELVREGVEHARAAESRIDTPAAQGALREVAEQYDRTAAALEAELQALNEPLPEPRGTSQAWARLRGALADRRWQDVVAGLEEGSEVTLDAFREVLHQEMPSGMRVLLGAHFHDMETAHHRLAALKEAVA